MYESGRTLGSSSRALRDKISTFARWITFKPTFYWNVGEPISEKEGRIFAEVANVEDLVALSEGEID